MSISIAARTLGVVDFGYFSYLIAIIGVGAKIIDFGFNPIIFRENSKDKSKLSYVYAALILRVIAVLVSMMIFLIMAWFFKFDSTTIILVVVLVINILLSNKYPNIRELIVIPFKVEFRMSTPMIMVVLDNVLLLLFVLVMDKFNGGLVFFIFIYTLSNLPGSILLFFSLIKNYGIKIENIRDEIKYLFRESFPLIGYIILAFVFTQLDILLLQYFSGSSSVGLYSSAMRLILPLKIIPNTVVISIFTIIVKNIETGNTNENIFRFVTKLFLLFTIIFTSTAYIYGNQILLLIFGEQYVDASKIFIILSFNTFFDFFSFFALDVLTAYGKQNYNFLYILFSTILLGILTIFLIPIFDFYGPAISRLIVGFLGFLYLIFTVKQKISMKSNFFDFNIIFLLCAVTISTFGLNLLNSEITFVINTVIILLGIFVFKIFDNYETNIIRSFINLKNFRK